MYLCNARPRVVAQISFCIYYKCSIISLFMFSSRTMAWANLLRFLDHKWHNYVNMGFAFWQLLISGIMTIPTLLWMSFWLLCLYSPNHKAWLCFIAYIGSMASNIPVQSFIYDQTGYSYFWVMNHTVHSWMILG